MTVKNDGGAAFPACNEANVNNTMGMSLRDWFAGQAMQARLSAAFTARLDIRHAIAADAYAIADAMLAARENNNG